MDINLNLVIILNIHILHFLVYTQQSPTSHLLSSPITATGSQCHLSYLHFYWFSTLKPMARSVSFLFQFKSDFYSVLWNHSPISPVDDSFPMLIYSPYLESALDLTMGHRDAMLHSLSSSQQCVYVTFPSLSFPFFCNAQCGPVDRVTVPELVRAFYALTATAGGGGLAYLVL